MAESMALEARARINEGSKSFSMASLFFDEATMRSAHLLYAWCRHCDDQIDEAGSIAEGLERLRELRTLTVSAIEDRLEPEAPFAFQALGSVVRTYRIPREYFSDLLAGMEMDLTQSRYQDFASLKLYCYRVAGVVGLMMAHIMGVSDERALAQAVDLGIAMQLTNIARDVRDDWDKGRVYLPLSWLAEAGVNDQDLWSASARPQLVTLIARLLDEADRYYASGDRGLGHLPLRSAFAVAAAREVYAGIGSQVLKRGAQAWDSRTYLTKGVKILKALRGLARVACLVPARLIRPWRRVEIQGVWRFS